MNATSAKSIQSRPHDQLPSIISPTPARTTSSDAGVKRRSPIRPALPANRAIAAVSPERSSTIP